MYCMQDSGVPLASDQPAVQPAVCKALFRLLFFFSPGLLFFRLQQKSLSVMPVHAGQWRASG